MAVTGSNLPVDDVLQLRSTLAWRHLPPGPNATSTRTSATRPAATPWPRLGFPSQSPLFTYVRHRQAVHRPPQQTRLRRRRRGGAVSDRLSDRLPDHTRATTHAPGLFVSVNATPGGRFTRMAWKRSTSERNGGPRPTMPKSTGRSEPATAKLLPLGDLGLGRIRRAW